MYNKSMTYKYALKQLFNIATRNTLFGPFPSWTGNYER